MALTHSPGVSVGARLWEVIAITKHKEVRSGTGYWSFESLIDNCARTNLRGIKWDSKYILMLENEYVTIIRLFEQELDTTAKATSRNGITTKRSRHAHPYKSVHLLETEGLQHQRYSRARNGCMRPCAARPRRNSRILEIGRLWGFVHCLADEAFPKAGRIPRLCTTWERRAECLNEISRRIGENQGVSI